MKVLTQGPFLGLHQTWREEEEEEAVARTKLEDWLRKLVFFAHL